ncbi:radical SAM domain protein [Campylobacter insulaenigrae]|uniref:radical SAM/SPASM domain-containing protein n=1 Tax=Campylobacter insulaenigrae TaxID=260714 RepID=UPI000F6E5FD5|nr:radical SAM/SPASM domain-containing protein [Campylobacter insulaenigrae]MCR6590974.1 SPASM domain-containing protein [Campylobacter insulaenigrae]MCR6592247.1 SPASM domain-containing protein [Campylobacter insulaenigrae]VEJ52476.1 radical SAM domain protein [Campylobacter insulaenigrae]
MSFEKIYIELSDVCGLKCDFCPSIKGQRKKMDLDKFEHICKSVQGFAKIYTFHVLGDPLMNKYLKDYLNIANKYNMKIELTTSGFYFDDERIKLILNASNIHQVNISLAAFLSQSKININAYFKPILEFIFLHIKNKKSSFINLRLWNLDKNFVPPLENNQIYEFLQDIFCIKIHTNLEKNRLARHIVLNQARLFKWPSLQDKILNEVGSCHALTKQIAILSDGTLVPCCLDVKADINLGNCFEQSFEELLHSSLYLDLKHGFQQRILKAELCKRCEFYKAQKV